MKIVLLLPLLFLLNSCEKRFSLKSQNGIYFIEGVLSELNKTKEIEWKIGRDREANISKGVRFHITVPRLKREDEKKLMTKYGVDSLIFRFVRAYKGQTTVMNQIYFPFKNMTRNTEDFSVNLFYQAASISKTFRNFHCPAFDHRLKVEDFEVKTRSAASKENIYIRLSEYVKGQVSLLKYAPTVLPGGSVLKGDYFVDLAFYNSSKKQRYSKWHKTSGILSIQREVKKHVQSCIGVKEENNPLPESRIPNIRDLEIK